MVENAPRRDPSSSRASTDTAALGPKPGIKLGDRYRLGALTGRGSRHVEFQGVDEHLGQLVQIVAISRHHRPDDDETSAPSVLRSRLDHPAILPVLSRERHGPWDYVVTRFVSGTTMADRIGQAPQLLATERIVELMLDCLDALEHAHQLGIVHGDLCPANLHRGRDGRVRLMGFDHADPSIDPVSTEATPYASPERLRGESVDARSDLYALACTFWALGNGRAPFGTDPDESRDGHLGHRLPDSPFLPDSLDRVLREAMAKRPEMRPDSAARMREALAAVQVELTDPDAAWAEWEEDAPPTEPYALLEGTLDPAPPRIADITGEITNEVTNGKNAEALLLLHEDDDEPTRSTLPLVAAGIAFVVTLAGILGAAALVALALGLTTTSGVAQIDAPVVATPAVPEVALPEVALPDVTTDEAVDVVTDAVAAVEAAVTPEPEPTVAEVFATIDRPWTLSTTPVRVPVAFAFDSYEPLVGPEFDAFAAGVQVTRTPVLLTGHTDSIGTREVNQMMGLGRAVAVQNLLVQRGVRDIRIEVTSAGEESPIAPNDTAEGRAQNRRVEAELHNQ